MWLRSGCHVSHPERIVQFSRSFHAYGCSFTQTEEQGARTGSARDKAKKVCNCATSWSGSAAAHSSADKSSTDPQQNTCCGAESGAASRKRTAAADSRRTNEENAVSANFETKSSLEHARAGNGWSRADFRKWHCVCGANYS